MIWFLIFIFTFYVILIVSLTIGFKKVDDFIPKNQDLETNFSVIIPFRNEAENLPLLLESISKLKYPKELVEFLFIDDDSSDSSVEIIKNFLSVIPNEERGGIYKNEKHLKPLNFALGNIRVIKNVRASNSPKKDAITTAINIAKNDWILTTDADCILPKNWLHTFNDFIQHNNPKMVVAPVNYKVKDTFLEQFQLIDFMSMQGTTIGGFGLGFPFLCNGANLGYKKEEFLSNNGFEGNNTIASGDDVFLFEKFLENDKKSVQFLKSKEAIVTTFPVKSWTDLINQRTRWAAKTGNFKSVKVKLIGLLVLLMNLSVILTFFLADSLQIKLLPFGLKFLIDLFLFAPTIRFFKHEKSFLKWYLLSSFVYPIFSVLVIFKSIFFKYHWKGRSFKK